MPNVSRAAFEKLPTPILVVDPDADARLEFISLLQSVAPRQSGPTMLDVAGETDPLITMGELAMSFVFDEASSDEEALALVAASLDADQPYALAFIDLQAVSATVDHAFAVQLWSMDPRMQLLLCSAQPQIEWESLLEKLKFSARILILEKPYRPVELCQCVHSLLHKWHGERKLREQMDILEGAVRLRTMNLEEINEQLRCEIRLRQETEIELALAQKLEAVGRLAAGIAHEINTPIQYISDSANFLETAYGAMTKRASVCRGGDPRSHDNCAYLQDEIPAAIARIVKGTERVAKIVRSMGEFAHPGETNPASVDLNRVLESTVLIASHEYRHVAAVEMDLGAIPTVLCHAGKIGQVFLNLLVNAAHAIVDAGRNSDTGRIFIRTRVERGCVEVTIQDNGLGISAENLPYIYDPFFTTKSVGRGTGQGLAIARSIVVDGLGGTIDVRSTGPSGTCFAVCLRIASTGSTIPPLQFQSSSL